MGSRARAAHDAQWRPPDALHNLEALPPTGFKIACFPVKMQWASAGWTRAVAIIEE
jgi:hypothetical protein